MWWVVIIAGVTFQFADHVVNQSSFRFFSARTEYILCLQGTLGPEGVTIDDYETSNLTWSAYNGAVPSVMPVCSEVPGAIAVLHPHLPHWEAHVWPTENNRGQTGGAYANCDMSERDIIAWVKSELLLSVIQCDLFRWAIFARAQLSLWDGTPLAPWVFIDLLKDARPGEEHD